MQIEFELRIGRESDACEDALSIDPPPREPDRKGCVPECPLVWDASVEECVGSSNLGTQAIAPGQHAGTQSTHQAPDPFCVVPFG